MSTFTPIASLPRRQKEVDDIVWNQFRKELISVPVVFVGARKPEAKFVAHKSRFAAINAPSARLFASSSAVHDALSPVGESVPGETLQLCWEKVFGASKGLSNFGNTCFLNSALQCVANTAPLVQRLLQEDEVACACGSGEIVKSASSLSMGASAKFSAAKSRFCAYCALKKVLKDLYDTGRSRSAVAPVAIARHLRALGPTFQVGRQEDAHEFVRELLSKCDEASVKHSKAFLDFYVRPVAKLLPGESPPQKPKPTGVFFAIYGSYVRSRVSCRRCGYNSDTFDPYMDFSIELQGHSVERSLRHFTAPEQLDLDNLYTCSACKKKIQPIKRLQIWHPPNVLTIHLKRFNIYGKKINKEVTYTETLDLQPYMCEESPYATHNSSQPSPHIYSLYAVLLHHGMSSRSGHYTSIVKASNGVWLEADDESVSKTSLRNALTHTHDAYILFYTRKNPIPTNDISRLEANGSQRRANGIPRPGSSSTASNGTQNHHQRTLTQLQEQFLRGRMDVDQDGESYAESAELGEISSKSGRTLGSDDGDASSESEASGSDSSSSSSGMVSFTSESDDDDGDDEEEESRSSKKKKKVEVPSSSSSSSSPPFPSLQPKQKTKKESMSSEEERRRRQQDAMNLLFGAKVVSLAMEASEASEKMKKAKRVEVPKKKAAFDVNVWKANQLYGGNLVSSWAFSAPSTPVATAETPSNSRPKSNKQPKVDVDDVRRTEKGPQTSSLSQSPPSVTQSSPSVPSTSSSTTKSTTTMRTKSEIDELMVLDPEYRLQKMTNRAISELQLVSKANKKRTRSAYDIDYDRGRVRKVKKLQEGQTPHASWSTPTSSSSLNTSQSTSYSPAPPHSKFQRASESLINGRPAATAAKDKYGHIKGGADRVKRLQQQSKKKKKKHHQSNGDTASRNDGGPKKPYFKKAFWKKQKKE